MSTEISCIEYFRDKNPYIQVGDYEIRLESEPPSEAVLQKARNELREVPEITAPAILELREMVKGKTKKLHKLKREKKQTIKYIVQLWTCIRYEYIVIKCNGNSMLHKTNMFFQFVIVERRQQ